MKIFSRKSDIFFFAQNIDCGFTIKPPHRGGSNEYPQSMFRSKNKKNRYTPAYPSFAIKWGIRGHKCRGHVFLMKTNSMRELYMYRIILQPTQMLHPT